MEIVGVEKTPRGMSFGRNISKSQLEAEYYWGNVSGLR